MENSKKGLLLVLRGSRLSVTQFPVTTKDREEMSSKPYASSIGSIMYVMLNTRPDVALAISLTNRFQSNPRMEHWNAVKNILKYLRIIKDLFLVYGGCEEELVVMRCIDASLGTDLKRDTCLC